ncbi:MAG: SsrA-binding protein SmpB [Opitutales bacterium]
MAPKNQPKRYKEIRHTRAKHDYFIDDTLECGIVLTGTEVKSLRAGLAQINESFVRFERGVPMLYHAHIAEYAFGNLANHKPVRPRKLLMHRKEITKWEHSVQAGGYTVIPLRMYFKKALVKVEIGLARGKKHYDKRETLKEREDLREAQRLVKHHLS